MLKRLIVPLLLQLVGVFVFLSGFFPQKNVLSGDASFTIETKIQENTKPPFDKLVLVVIDALRSDFLYNEVNSGFSFVHSKINSGEGWGYTAYSNPPTVTLPRLKGITTGSTPSFLDAILNVAEDDSSSNIKDQDSWPRQFHNHGFKLRFFGDDTWLKLLPNDIFDKYEGTNSFFVSDFEQVDLNVTRNIPEQLNESKEWDVLILHYLGLDHIGHKGGSNSTFMPAKHREMDGVIERLYNNMKDDTLMIIMGDHGMNDVGNHGGSSAGETSAGLVFLSKKLAGYDRPIAQKNVKVPMTLDDPSTFQYLTSIQQMDLVPTISSLFNVPIPKNSVGVLIPEFIQLLNKKVANIKIMENYKQLLDVAKEIDVQNYLSEFKVSKKIDTSIIINKMKGIQQDLIRNATDYNYDNISVGYGVLLIATIIAIICAIKIMHFGPPFALTMAISILLGLSCFGSSFIEEEHQLWWWIITALVVFGYIHSTIIGNRKFKLYFIVFVCLRLIRGWNNTGQQTTYSYVISNILEAKSSLLWALNIWTVFILCMRGFKKNPTSFISSFTLGMMVLTYKMNWSIVNKESVPEYLHEIVRKYCEIYTGTHNDSVFEDALIPMATLFFQSISSICFIKIMAVMLKMQKSDTLLNDMSKYITLLLIFLSSSSNIPQFLIFEILRYCIIKIVQDQYDSSIYIVSLISLILQNFTFFQFGGTNSIATIDLVNAYHGISENYNIYVIGGLMVMANFAPAIYWTMLAWGILYKSVKSKTDTFVKCKIPYVLFNCIVGCSLLAACIALRYHLFIWSVFSPKLCYYAGWTLFMNVIVGCLLEGFLVSLV
ncbi:similar to Saccharomyces cerevisiae YJL062W LAS21 Integral plasma membrane protein involved in the synthesis of the glycosylphosphatidylinositol (GPI) core structure [Maudiozyma barnettii]|uniref:GPI ethanolamine phosphate transferase 2 n=1 Tax=Maudiozyma barnettii TaxID=61262 RepID=A0A8H2VJF0_9SACH|nr:mannose-ethanolamine phosphotransferase LAS21 [Kazachstania barnettii]CAB4256856.1 similar to Saccharomyces cerevisiae YJL062W LAS21 Integral plasma membrane protein involved in the synthesis of the glycosylphosphatidylinositol (GPI) core structure [Kazachstania barnettii]CAD1785275.1 similar to Saccharomyces cerevisiae YJL062W LAS21 Integral plasma membrane protein involved in the synthesis of the glycosylphosphatidylinositol (GPI) core structure [Kazachstania barnettii]